VWWLIPAISWGQIDAGPAMIAGLTGLFWLLFLLQTGLALAPRQIRFWLCLAGLVLGALSTWPTLFVVLWQEKVWGFDWERGDDLMSGLKYFTLGVGVREELMKLLLLMPLLPWLIARRNELERLIVASCIGLGFAVEENIGYFVGSGSTKSIGRYLTANFWHLASTGLAGLWLCRAIRWPKDCGLQFVAYLALFVLGHGVYDALLMAGEYAIISSLVFLGLAYAYFREIRELRPPQREAISLTANFAIGLSLLAAVTFAYVTAHVGLRETNQIFLQPAVAASLMAYVFLREVPDSLVRT
jgi:RsiW-degrading membrane proteinase PrsW (M82 family)